MQLSIASGKGGTGKTMVAANLAAAVSRHLSSVYFLDCDVEAPNAALFLQPQIHSVSEVFQFVPRLDEEKCTLCGLCARNCQFNALVASKSKILFFPELCHSCGGCILICPEQAIAETPARIGTIQKGTSVRMPFFQGKLDIGRPSPVGIIQQMFQEQQKSSANEDHSRITIVDSPPGVSCAVVASTRGSDFVILVSEPTPFGLHDLRLAVQLVRDELKIPFGVILNKSDDRIAIIDEYCAEEGISILQRIPFSRQIAEIYAKGQLLIDVDPIFESLFLELWEKVRTILQKGKP